MSPTTDRIEYFALVRQDVDAARGNLRPESGSQKRALRESKVGAGNGPTPRFRPQLRLKRRLLRLATVSGTGKKKVLIAYLSRDEE
jgi:hypothetical protein